MGILKQGILGGFSGKVANVVGSSWKGIAVIKSRPLSVSNPRTAGQTSQRTKFSTAVSIAVALLATIVKPLWDRFAQQASGYNEFIAANISAISSSGVVTYADLIMSRGALIGVADISDASSSAATNKIYLSFTGNSDVGNASSNDEIYLAVYNETTGTWDSGIGSDDRGEAETQLTLSNNATAGDTMHIYLSMRRVDGTLVSNSQYITFAMPA